LATIISLPYANPEGIIKVNTIGTRSVIIHSLIADGKKIYSKYLFPRQKILLIVYLKKHH
jgi:hypothetical protein